MTFEKYGRLDIKKLACGVAGLGATLVDAGQSPLARLMLQKAVKICTLELGSKHTFTKEAETWLARCVNAC